MGWGELGVLGSLPDGPSCQQPCLVPASWPPRGPSSGWPPPGSSAGCKWPPPGPAPPAPTSRPAWPTCGHPLKVTTARPAEGLAGEPQGGWWGPWTSKVLLGPRPSSGALGRPTGLWSRKCTARRVNTERGRDAGFPLPTWDSDSWAPGSMTFGKEEAVGTPWLESLFPTEGSVEV